MLTEVLRLTWDGLVQGSLIAIAALGLTLIFGILNYINAAYAEYLTAGAYATLTVSGAFEPDLMIVPAVLAGAVAGAVVALVSEELVFRPFRSRPPIILLIVSLSLGSIYRALVRVFFSPEEQFFQLSLGSVSLGFTNVSPVQPAIVASSVGVLAGFYLLLQRTDIGIAMRAIASDKALARTFGLDAEFVIVVVTLLGGAVAGLAGAMLGIFSSVGPTLGFGFLIPVFAAVIVGGIGDPFGAIVAGYIIGIGQSVSILVIPSKYTPAVALLALIVTLLIRPKGIFGEATR